MTYDLLIKDGLVVDGSGMAPIRADVGIKGGKIVARGNLGNRATRVIDAQGQVVCPGFIDIHTHYDPHWWWNPLGTSSSWQGVTTVVQGNCGLTLAPCRPEHRPVMACAVKRRRFSSGCKPHPATAPAGSNRSNCGGNETVEAFG
jgi:N-acyl-D-amino-acid deacylase